MNKVKQLDALVAKKMDFTRRVPVSGQTYSRKHDSQVLDAVGGLSQTCQ